MYEYFIGPDGVFNTPLTAILFTVLQFAFMATESRRRRAAPSDATRAVTKTFPPLFLALMVGLFARLLCGFLKIGVVRGDARDVIVFVGFVLAVGGWLLRVWAQQHTGKFFVGEVAVQRDHQVIQTGPYQWVRHPAYTGGVLSAFGFGLVLSTWLGALISGGLLLWAYTARVPQEENLLAAQLGDAYKNYMTRTKRFVPFVF
jgi:protein-S-isoprenylcysteine O-methyltransferase Ste14